MQKKRAVKKLKSFADLLLAFPGEPEDIVRDTEPAPALRPVQPDADDDGAKPGEAARTDRGE